MNETLRNRDAGQWAPNRPARLIVWENDGFWARHLRRLLGPDGPRVFESRTFEACCEMIGASPASLVVIQWSPALSTELARLVTRMHREFPMVRMLAVGDRTLERFRWQILEAGMAWLCTSPRDLAAIVEIVRNHLKSVPEPARTPEQRIWDELPWPRMPAVSQRPEK